MIESLPAPVPAVAPEEEGWTQGKPPWLSEAEYAADRCIYRCMKCPHCRKRCSEFLSFWKIEGLRRRYRAFDQLRGLQLRRAHLTNCTRSGRPGSWPSGDRGRSVVHQRP